MCADIVASIALPKVKSEISAKVTPYAEDVPNKTEVCATPHTQFQSELLALFVKSELTASLAIPLLAVVVAMGLLPWAPLVSVLRWLATLFIAKGVLIYLCRRFQRLDRNNIDVKRWRRYLAAGELFYGTAWASILFVNFNAADQRSAFFFVFAAIMIVVAMRTMFASSVLTILYAGTVPMTSALVLRFAMTGEPFYWAMAGLAVGIHVYLVFLASGLQSTVVAMLKYKARTDGLVEKLKTANAESDLARRRAETANKAKSQFLANMSHELRTPLNAILGFSEVMKDEILGPLENGTYKSYSDDIHKSGQHLLNLINQILDLSRIEAGRYELQEEPVSLAKVMDDCQKLLQMKAESKGVRIVEQFDDSMALLWAEQRAIRQICLNLLSNAVKFTPTDGVITLSAGITPNGEQFLAVKDNGPGIPEIEIPRVMSPFGQGTLSQETAEGGSGLGLPIVKGLVDLHGGRFELISRVRQGTEVKVVFPVHRIMQPTLFLGAASHAQNLPPVATMPVAGHG